MKIIVLFFVMASIGQISNSQQSGSSYTYADMNGHEDTVTLRFLNDIIKRKTDSSSIYYTDKVHEGMYDYMMEKKLIKRRIKDIYPQKMASLTLTSSEIRQLKESLTSSKIQEWPDELFPNSKRIRSDSALLFLSGHKDKNLYLFSKPAFIRNNTVALFYVVHLCCGGTCGPVDLSFYRRENGTWKKWIRIGGGAF